MVLITSLVLLFGLQLLRNRLLRWQQGTDAWTNARTVPRQSPANGVQRLLLNCYGLLAAGLLLVLPLTMIFAQVAAGGWSLLIENLSADYLHHAFGLTLLATLVTIR